MTEHRHAEKLRAIADGKQMQILVSYPPSYLLASYPPSYHDCSATIALNMLYLGRGAELRIKPEPKVFRTWHDYHDGNRSICYTVAPEHGGGYKYILEHTIHEDGTVEVRVVK